MKLNLSVLAVFAVMQSGWSQVTCLKGDCKNGYGEAQYASGAKYFGEFVNGRAHGLGTMYFPEGHRYSGHWRDQVREGQGRFTFASGDEYLGAFARNQMEGSGVMRYANGNVYKGEWQANEPHGMGELTFASGIRYAGFFVKGAFEGAGTMWYTDGARYEGSWRKGQRDGQGTLFLANGKMQHGIWGADTFLGASLAAVEQERLGFKMDTSTTTRNCNLEYCDSGIGEYTYRNGALYVGQFRQGVPEGQARVYYPTGDRYEGFWRNHQPQGKGVMHYASGKMLGAIWEAGLPAQMLFEDNSPVLSIGNNVPEVSTYNPSGIRVWAVVVGVAQYTHMPALRFTDDDAYQIYAFLKSPEGGALPGSQIQLLIDEDATYKKVLQALRKAADEAEERDVLLFYFSGHGIEGAFLPVDYDGYNNQMFHETIREVIQNSKARHKIVIADACHSGNLFATRSSVQAVLEKYYGGFAKSKGGMALMLSSKGEEYSLEDSGLRSGIYSHYLIKGAKGPADRNGDGMVTVKEMHEYLYRNVRTYTAGAQTPLLLGNFDPNMPLGVIRR